MGQMADALKAVAGERMKLILARLTTNRFMGALTGALVTAIIQSSSVTTVLVVGFISAGLMSMAQSIGVIMGANIGTTVTAQIVAFKITKAALVHAMFNVFGVLLWVAFIPQLAAAVTLISPPNPGLDGTARLAAEAPRQIANAHTFFNVANTLIFIWFTAQFARLVPDRPLKEAEAVRARFLDEALLETPSLALDRVRLEIGHMGAQVRSMLKGLMPALLRGDSADLRRIAGMDNAVDALHGHIVSYLGRVSPNSTQLLYPRQESTT
jgi:phosphate:Na+ symporter